MIKHTNEELAYLALSKVKGIYKRELYDGLERFSSGLELYRFLRLQPKVTIPDLSEVSSASNFITYDSEYYPSLLKQINDPPLVIFYKGNIGLLKDMNKVSIVGTRLPTDYGLKSVKEITNLLVASGNVIVSGMAFGIDAAAHKQSLLSKGKTIAVLGTSVEVPYPRTNRKLYREILENEGLIISDSDETEVNKWVFPRRNRIIAGLSSRTIVIEAANKSGAIITANLAFDYNRQVYALPGGVYSEKSIGCHNLIKDNKAEIISSFDTFGVGGSRLDNLNETEKRIVSILQISPSNIYEISASEKLDTAEVFQVLLQLEIKKIVAKDSGGNYTLT